MSCRVIYRKLLSISEAFHSFIHIFCKFITYYKVYCCWMHTHRNNKRASTINRICHDTICVEFFFSSIAISQKDTSLWRWWMRGVENQWWVVQMWMWYDMSESPHRHAKRITITTIACDTCRMPNNVSQTIQNNMPQLNAHIYLPLLICYDLIARTKIKLFSENIINILFIIPLYIQQDIYKLHTNHICMYI